MKKLFLLISSLLFIGCAHDTDIRPDCKNWSVFGAYTIEQQTGKKAMIAVGMGAMREAKWWDNSMTSIVTSPHCQAVTVDQNGKILDYWSYDGLCWIPSHSEMTEIKKLETVEYFMAQTLPRLYYKK